MAKSRNRNIPCIGCDSAEFTHAPAFTKGKRPRGSKRAGHLFEKAVQAKLFELFGDSVISNAWIAFEDTVYGERLCSPDVFVIEPDRGLITIVECKLTHTDSAYHQLGKYEIVLQTLFPNYKIRGVEIYKYLNSNTYYPVTPKVVHGLEQNFSGIGNIMSWQN